MIDSFVNVLLYVALQVTLVALVAMAVDVVIGRNNAAATRWIMTSTIAVIFFLSSLVFVPFPAWQFPTSPSSPIVLRDTTRTSSVMSTATTDRTDEAAKDAAKDAMNSIPHAPPKKNAADATPVTTDWSLVAGDAWREFQRELQSPLPDEQSAGTRWRWPAWIAGLFGLGIVIGQLRLLGGLWALHRLRQAATVIDDSELHAMCRELGRDFKLAKPVELRESPHISTAALAGVRHPMVLLPRSWRGWTAAQRRAVLAHEIAHISHHDFLINVGSQAVLAMHFYHPLVHWLVRRLRLAQELAADAAAASITGGHRVYLHSLAELALVHDAGQVRGPALAFLPSRRTFLRRIEVLRSNRPSSVQLSMPMRLAVLVAMLTAGLVAAGLRGNALAQDQATPESPPRLGQAVQDTTADDQTLRNATAHEQTVQQRAAQSTVSENADTPAPLAAETSIESALPYVPRGALAIVVANVAKMRSQPAMQPAMKLIEEPVSPMLQSNWSVMPEQVERVILYYWPSKKIMHMGTIVQLTEPVNLSLPTKTIQRKYLNQTYYELPDSTLPRFVAKPNAKTIVAGSSDEELRAILMSAALPLPDRPGTRALLPTASSNYLSVQVDARMLRHVAANQLRQMSQNMGPLYGAISPMIDNTHDAMLSIGYDNQNLTFTLHLVAEDPASAAEVASTLQAAAVLARNALKQAETQLPEMPGDTRAFMLVGTSLASSTLESLQVRVSDQQVEATAEAPAQISSTALALLAPALQSARASAERAQSINKLKQIALAMVNYESIYGHFPPAVVMGGPFKDVPRSWRVELLPFLEEVVLYNEYRQDEPWDSEHNRQLIARMPDVYRSSAAPDDSTMSSYFVFTGPETIFADNDGTKLLEITDGTSQTLLAVEASREIPWTKPEDIPYASDGPLPELTGLSIPDGFIGSRADGSVGVFSQTIDAATLRSLIEKADGQ